MPTALALNRPAVARPPLPLWESALPDRLAQPDAGDWFASSLELRRGLFVLDLCPDTPGTDWLELFSSH